MNILLNSNIQQENSFLFKHSNHFINPVYVRSIYFVLTAFYGLFILIDLIYLPERIVEMIFIRFFIVIPLFIIVIIMTYTKHFVKHNQILISTSFVIGGMGVAYILLLNTDNIIYYGGLFMVFFCGYMLMRLHYRYAFLSGIIVFLFYFLGYLRIYHGFDQQIVTSSFFFIATIITGTIGAYNQEKMIINKKKYEEQMNEANRLLQKQFEEKKEQLERLETRIKENEILKEINLENERLANSLRESEEQYRLLATQMHLGLALHEIICDETGNPVDYKFLSVNDSFEDITGLKREDIIGKTVTSVLPNTESYWIETYGRVAQSGQAINFEQYSKSLERYYSINAFSPKKGQFAVIFEDITKRKRLEEDLSETNEKFITIFEKSPVAIEFYDVNGCHMYSNEAALALYGVLNPPELKGQELFKNPNLDKKLVDRLLKHESVNVEIEYDFNKVKKHNTYQTSKSGKMILKLSVTPLMNQGKLSGYILHSEDMTKERKEQKEIEYLSYHDYLTGIYNRRYFVMSYQKYIMQQSFPLGVMMIDINGLKIINDAYGHLYGDIAIKRVAGVLSEIFGKYNVVSRIGGDEFAVLVPHKGPLEMQSYKEKIIHEINLIQVGNIELSLAIGYEVLYDDTKDIDDILSQAENYLYRHKVTVGASVRNHAIKAILNTLTDKYEDEKIHSKRVSDLCRRIGFKLGLHQEDVNLLELAGMYHDIGKISIPDAILNKPAKLTNEEFEIIKTHTLVGYQILKAADEYSSLAEYALSHHERWDGKGYPKGLMGHEIPLFSRIICLADSFEAMTADRPYRKGMSIDQAIEELKRCSGGQFDPELVQVFLKNKLYEEEQAN